MKRGNHHRFSTRALVALLKRNAAATEHRFGDGWHASADARHGAPALGQIERVEVARYALNKASTIGGGSSSDIVRPNAFRGTAPRITTILLDGLRKAGWRG
jgi:hypothetical protein